MATTKKVKKKKNHLTVSLMYAYHRQLSYANSKNVNSMHEIGQNLRVTRKIGEMENAFRMKIK